MHMQSSYKKALSGFLFWVILFLCPFPQAWGQEDGREILELRQKKALSLKAGNFKEALRHTQKLAEINERNHGADHPLFASSLNDLGEIYFSMGDFEKGGPLIRRALKIREKTLGPDHPDVALSLNNLAILYDMLGDYEKAEPLYQRSLQIKEKALGPDHPDVGRSLNNLAGLFHDKGNFEKAEPLYRRSLEIVEKSLNPDHPDVAISLNNLANLYLSMGQKEKAAPLYLRAFKIQEKTLGPSHPLVAASLNNLAILNHSIRNYGNAEPLYQRSLQIWEKVLGPDHPNVAAILHRLAVLEGARGNFTLVLDYFKKALIKEEVQIRNVFSITTERQKLRFMELNRYKIFMALSLIHQKFTQDPNVIRWGMELILRRKGIVFDAQSRQKSIIQNRLTGTAKKNWEALSLARRNFSQLLLRQPSGINSDQYLATVDSLRKQIEEREELLASQSALVERELKQRKIDVKSLASKLPSGSVLIEFMRIRDWNFENEQWMGNRYLAFILLSDSSVKLVDLGSSDDLEKHARTFLQEIHMQTIFPYARSKKVLKASSSLRELLWKPMEKYLAGTKRIFISPDGIFNLVPLAALIFDDGKYLVEKYQIAYLTTGRELVGNKLKTPKNEIDLFMVANPDYDSQTIKSGKKEANLARFLPLPGTQVEADLINALFTDENKKTKTLTGASATEAAVKEVKNPRILHLATHGYFIRDEEITLPSNTRVVSIVKSKTKSAIKPYENPLVRSGLAFAGANRSTEAREGDDGLLTALEISGMDLYGTELVVLSACDTGVGDIKNGEGVFGLRRSFALSGVRNLMMSLWPVSDAITARQMVAFYKNLQTRPPAEALRRTQLKTIKDLRAKYGQAPIALWAPFILQGAGAFEKSLLQLDH